MEFKFQTKFEFKQRRGKIKQKKEKKEREEASLWPRPARLHGPASLPTPSQRARAVASWPAHELAQAQQPARMPLTPTRLPTFACSCCHTGLACQPSCSSSPRHAPTAHADSLLRPSPDSTGRGRRGGHARGMALSPWRRVHATTRGHWMQAHAPDHP